MVKGKTILIRKERPLTAYDITLRKLNRSFQLKDKRYKEIHNREIRTSLSNHPDVPKVTFLGKEA